MRKIMNKYRALYRIAATILIFCMTFEGNVLPISASGYGFAQAGSTLLDKNNIGASSKNTDSAAYTTDDGSTLASNSSNAAETGGKTSLDGDTDGKNAAGNNEAGNATSPDGGGANNGNLPDDADNNNPPDNDADDSPNNGNNDANPSDDDTDDSPNNGNDDANPSDNDADDSPNNGNDDGNSPDDNETNDENLPDTDETDDEPSPDDDGNDDEIDETNGKITSNQANLDDILKAEAAFADLVSRKDVMALIYLTDVCHVRSLADGKSNIAASLESGHTVYLLGVTITPDEVWYKVQFWLNGAQLEGYVERGYLAYSDEDWLKWDEEYLYKLADAGTISHAAIGLSSYAASYADVEKFPTSYWDALTQLKSAHPNWTFVPMNTKLDFETAVSKEMGVKSLIQNTASNAGKGWVGAACPTTAGWYYANKDAVSYYMDPRNFLSETYIFQFEQLTFNSSYHTVDAIQSFLNSTFMKGTLPDDAQKRTYAQAFYEIGQGRKLSPIHLASRVYQEQGQGTSGLISGKYPGYEGYYNYFNVKANGSTNDEVIKNGLAHAKSMGWNTRYKSLEGGAATIGNNYILKCQDTLYLEKFNVDSNSPYGLYEHQYMQNIQAPASESASTKKMYASVGSLNSAFVFKIPVYSNMPSANPLVEITLDQEEVTLRRPDTVLADDSSLAAEEKEQNRASVALQVSYIPKDTTDDKTITWSSSNKKVATVKDGVITAVGIGEATITAKAANAGGKTAKCKVTVIAPVYKIEFSSESNADTILAGQSLNLSAEYFPADTTSDTTVLWSSSDTSVATVARYKGSVQGVSAGTADIIAAIGNYSASHKITVEACTVTFMGADNKTVLKTFPARYGESITQADFPDVDDPLFIGWYTGEDGTGSRFDYGAQINQKETVLYPCFKKQGKGFNVVPVGDQTYTGSAVKPAIIVYDSVSYDNSVSDNDNGSNDNSNNENNNDNNGGLITLVLGRDYTVSYKNNKKAASANDKNPPTITIKGKGNYAGTETVTFNIIPKALTDTDIAADNITAAYTGKTIKGSPAVCRNGKKLVKNTDYKLSYPQTGAGAYQNAGTYPVTITGIGGYSGKITIYETISRKELLSKASIAKIPNQIYDPSKIDRERGIGIEPTLKVTYKKKALHESTDGGKTGDYVITYKNNLDIGTATATITAADRDDNPYTGSKSITFKITAISISKAEINGVENKTYAGEPDYPETSSLGKGSSTKDIMQVTQDNISVSLSGNVLTESTDGGKTGDYILEYKNNTKAGTAAVIVKGINKYTGTKKKTYKITACDLSTAAASDISLRYCTEDNAANAPGGIPAETLPIASLNDITSPYVKGGTKPIVLISYKGKELAPGTDYTIKYKNNNAITTSGIPENKLPMITITGKGLFKGSLSGKFHITDGVMSDDNAKITMTAKDVVYKPKKGGYKTSAALIDVNGKKLQAGKDYGKNLKYTYAEETSLTNAQGGKITRNAGEEVNENDIPNVGTAIRITAAGAGAYAGNGETAASKSAVYRITAADISKAKVTVAAKTYNNGQPVTLTKDDITVTLNGKTLALKQEGENGETGDYEIDTDTYVGNCNKGKASVIIKGCGANYGGAKKVSFTIKGKLLSWMK